MSNKTFAYIFALCIAVITPLPALALSFESIVDDATTQSYDLRLSDLDRRLARNDIQIAKAGLYPTLTAGYNSQYTRALSGVGAQQVAVVGSVILPGGTQYQQVFTIGSNYTLFDAGVHRSDMRVAQRKAEASTFFALVKLRDMKLSLIDIYTPALLDFHELRAKQEIIAIRRELYTAKRRLYESRAISKVELGEEAIQLATLADETQTLTERLMGRLQDLSQFTHRIYNVDTIQIEDFSEQIQLKPMTFAAESLPDFLAYGKEIDSKKAELSSISRQRFPQINFYSNLVFYGAHPTNWFHALNNLDARQVYLGLAVNMPLFDGFKNLSERKKRQLEIQRLTTERDKRIWELQSQFNKFASAQTQYDVELKTKAEVLNSNKDKLGMVEALSENKLIDHAVLLQQKIAVIEQGLALRKTKLLRTSIYRRNQILIDG